MTLVECGDDIIERDYYGEPFFLSEIEEWAAENFRGTYRIAQSGWVIFFENTEDAILFKLRWL